MLDPEALQDPAISTPSTPFFKPGGWSINLYGGSYEVADESQFVGIRNEHSLGLGFSADLNRYPYLGLDFELFYVNRDYDTPVGDQSLASFLRLPNPEHVPAWIPTNS